MKIKWSGKVIPEPNGCGPQGWQWAVPNWCFKPACDLHDNLFSVKVGFIEANLSFLRRMNYYAHQQPKHVWFYKIMAFIYYLAVSSPLGWLCYHKVGTRFKAYVTKLFNIKR